MSIPLNRYFYLLVGLFCAFMNSLSAFAWAGDRNLVTGKRPLDINHLNCVASYIRYPEVHWGKLGLLIEKAGPNDLPANMYVMAVPQEHIRHALTHVEDPFIFSLLEDRKTFDNYVLADAHNSMRRDVVAIQSNEIVRQMHSPLYLFDSAMHPIH